VKQVLQSLSNGQTDVADVPAPGPGPGRVLIRTTRSLVSAGTERMLVDFGRAGLIGKARQHPDRVRQVIDKARTDGLAPTLAAVRSRLDRPDPLGYCNVGEVMDGGGAFPSGIRVASNGRHAEVVSVPTHLCAAIPDEVDDESAAFTVIGAIALQGMRLAEPTLGESVAVIGLGLVGLVAVQLLRANGCRVLGLDMDPARLALARSFGAETVDLSGDADPVPAAWRFSRNRGMDAVLVTASTQSSAPIRHAASMSRKRGRIVLVGVTGLELNRADFYEKELTFQVSCSYGPGRHDTDYEERGRDYPVGFVRWTEQRNFEAVLDMMAAGRLDMAPLVTHRFTIAEAARAYDLITGDAPSLGVLLTYPGSEDPAGIGKRSVRLAAEAKGGAPAVVALVGAGNHAAGQLAPALKESGARLRFVVSAGGVSSLDVGRRFGFEKAATDVSAALADPAVNAAVIATRHDSHAQLAIAALAAGKHVFVEKPMALTHEELDAVAAAHGAAGVVLTVGFNRRFSPLAITMAELVGAVAAPKAFVMTVNAGALPSGHWASDPEVGGGRIVGEAVHFLDLLRFLASAPIVSHTIRRMGDGADDTATISLGFGDGSIGTIHYFANGSRGVPKERLEVFASGGVLQLDNFRRLRGVGWPGFRRRNLSRQDKGQAACVRRFVDAVESGRAPIPIDEIIEVSRVAIDLAAG